MDSEMREQARRALGVALAVAERSVEHLIPPSGGLGLSMPAGGMPPQPSAHFCPHPVTVSPATFFGSGVGQPIQPGPPPTEPRPNFLGAQPGVTRPEAGNGCSPASAVPRPRTTHQPRRSRSRGRRRSQRHPSRGGTSRAPRLTTEVVNDAGTRASRAIPQTRRRLPASRARRDTRVPRPPATRAPSASAPTASALQSGRGARPVFRGDPSPGQQVAHQGEHSGQPGMPAVPRHRSSRRARGGSRVDSADVVTIPVVSPATMVPTPPAGLYLRGLGTATVDSVERLYQSMSMVSPTLGALPQVFSLRQYPSGAALIMHPAFSNPDIVERVVNELGPEAANNGFARLDTAEGPILVRRAKEVRTITNE